MKPGENHELLDTILEDAGGNAPSADQVLADIRDEKRARASRRMIAGTVVSALLVALFISQSGGVRPVESEVIQPPATNLAVAPALKKSIPSVRSPGSAPSPQPESEWKIARIDDQQLLDLLADVPVALAQDSDGNSRLMMVVAAEE